LTLASSSSTTEAATNKAFVRGRYSPSDWNIAYQLTITQFKLKDQSSFFGFLWSFLHPLLLLAVLYAFFSFRFGEEIEHYVIYLMLGLVLYTHFSNATSLGMRTLKATRELTTDAVFPKELLVFSTLVSTSLELIISVAVCLALAWFTGLSLGWSILWLPILIISQFMLVTWVSLLLATIFPFAWDIDHIYNVFLRVLFFITPIFYDISFVGDGIARSVISLNPLAWIVQEVREVIIDGTSPDLLELGGFLAINATLIYMTLMLFRRFESRFAEHV